MCAGFRGSDQPSHEVSRANFDERSIVRGMDASDTSRLAPIDRAGRRCAVCRTGRRWREFTVVEPEHGQPVLMCPACQARHGTAPPSLPPAERPNVPPPTEDAPSTTPEPRSQEREDRVRRALRELSGGEYSTGRIAKAAALNEAKTLRRLRELAASGEVRQVGKRWSTDRAPTEIDLALDRLQARTNNIRVIRDRPPVG
jgi:hypothetical protein